MPVVCSVPGTLEGMNELTPTPASPAGPCAMVIFGAGGDLTKRLVVPALYNLVASKHLTESFAIIGVDLAEKTDVEWRQSLREMTEMFVKAAGGNETLDQNVWNWIESRMVYLRGDLNNPETYQELKTKLSAVDEAHGCAGNYLFYLAISDRFFGAVVDHLGQSGLAREEDAHWRRIVIEKPFGHDLASARALNRQILAVAAEKQIYRIDHFLGKETVQNIMMFRFANGMFEPIWNRDRIDHVQITVAETVGVERRGHFYETTGALRDMVPNHVFQLVAMTAMEAPNSFSADAVRSEKEKVVEAIRICAADEVKSYAVRGQYGPGEIDGKPAAGYREEPDVAADSVIETYAAMKLSIDNWRWSGVPFYVRTGKRLAARKSQLSIRFKESPGVLFRGTQVHAPPPNWLLVRIQPDEGIALEFGAKIPGPAVKVGDVRMDFKYADYFGAEPRTGYETLLYDVMIGDATLFQRADNVEAGWRVVQPVLDVWGNEKPGNFPNYAAGSQGPAEADELLARDGNKWRTIN
jgi:glucose-6-phosphate 1-dehydrogenase